MKWGEFTRAEGEAAERWNELVRHVRARRRTNIAYSKAKAKARRRQAAKRARISRRKNR